MKLILTSFSACLCLALSANSLRAQSYSIDWYKIAGGGGTSSNGQYSVSGTIGQHDAGGPMTGGNYSLTGGFWSLLSVVQTPGSPTLRIFLTTSNTAVIAWPNPSPGFALQQNGDLTASNNWTSFNGQSNIVGGEIQEIVTPPTGRNFFRLKSP
jgi:hypothetical protein